MKIDDTMTDELRKLTTEIDEALADVLADQPELPSDEAWHDIAEAVLLTSSTSLAVKRQFRRVNGMGR